MSHFPAYGVAPDYWSRRAQDADDQLITLALANQTQEKQKATLKERERLTSDAAWRNAKREKQLQEHSARLEEHRALLEQAYEKLRMQEMAQAARAEELRAWEAGLQQREENLKQLLSTARGGADEDGASSMV